MRRMMLTLLLATSVALPAHAIRPRDRVVQVAGAPVDGGQLEVGQVEGGQDAGGQAQPAGRPDRPERDERPQRAERAERERPQVSERANWSERGQERQRAVEQQAAQPPLMQQPQGERQGWSQRRQDGNAGDRQRRWGRGDGAGNQIVEQQRDGRRDRWPGGQVADQGRTAGQVVVQHDGRQGWDGRRDGERRWDGRHDGMRSRYAGTNRQWNSQWRQDRNYDWRHHRDRNRSIFRLGNYYDPYGSRYRHFSIGFNLFPSYYQSNYWLQDPWQYRLPPAYGPYRWVRYYDDALLVNVYTGQVADVIYSFFW